MSIRVFIDGRILDERSATIPVWDRGFLYGDSVYEVARTSGGRPVDLIRHLERLERSATALAFPLFPRADLAAAIEATLAAAANEESYLRVILTRGQGEYGLDPALSERPRLVVIVRPLTMPHAELYSRGASVAIVQARPGLGRAVDPTVKSGIYLMNALALAEAKAAGAYEPILCNSSGRLVEGSTSNFFVVAGGVVRTPSLDEGLLDGITRRRVIELARGEGVSVEEGHILPDDLRSADEAFLTSAVRGVMPVVRVDGSPLGDGTPGPVTRRVLAAYAGFLARVARGEL